MKIVFAFIKYISLVNIISTGITLLNFLRQMMIYGVIMPSILGTIIGTIIIIISSITYVLAKMKLKKIVG